MLAEHCFDAADFASRFAPALSSDRRSLQRLTHSCELLVRKSHSLSVSPANMRGWNRLWSNPKHSVSALKYSHLKALAESILRLDGNDITVAIDTTEIPLKFANRTSDAWFLRGQKHGYLHQAALALNAANGEVLGLVDSFEWAREKGQLHRHTNQFRPIYEKESLKWFTSSVNVSKFFSQKSVSFTIVADSECCIHEFFAFAKQNKLNVIVRTKIDRRINVGQKKQNFLIIFHNRTLWECGTQKHELRYQSESSKSDTQKN